VYCIASYEQIISRFDLQSLSAVSDSEVEARRESRQTGETIRTFILVTRKIRTVDPCNKRTTLSTSSARQSTLQAVFLLTVAKSLEA
jgi:hypothetical protein